MCSFIEQDLSGAIKEPNTDCKVKQNNFESELVKRLTEKEKETLGSNI